MPGVRPKAPAPDAMKGGALDASMSDMRESGMDESVDSYNFILASQYTGTPLSDAGEVVQAQVVSKPRKRKPAMSPAERQRKSRAIHKAARSHLSKAAHAAQAQQRRERYEEGIPVQPREKVDPLAGLCSYVARKWRGSSRGLRDPRISADEHKQCRGLWRRLMQALEDREKVSYTFNEFLFRAIGTYDAFRKDHADLSRTEYKRVRYSHRRVIAGICEERDLHIAGEARALLYRESRSCILRDGASLLDVELPKALGVPWIDE